MKIVITGAGFIGRSIAPKLPDHGHEHTLISNQPDKLHITSVTDADWVLADVCSPDVLADAGLAQVDVTIAVADDDKANLVISLLAKIEFAVPCVVVRLSNPKNEWFFGASQGVDVFVSAPRIMTVLVDEAVSVGISVRLFPFDSAGVPMYAIVPSEGSPLVDRRIVKVDLPPRTVLMSPLRSGRPVAPSDDGIFEAEDKLLLLVSDLEKNAPDTLTRLVEMSKPRMGGEAEEQA